jgi:putative hydrolase of HD superfamily
MTSITDYLFELDALKLVNRRSYVGGGVRLENAAEHSWHLAIACWSIARSFSIAVSEEKLIKLALLHDLGEIDAGDTFLYSSSRQNAHVAERAGINRLLGHAGNGIQDMAELWEEQETGDCAETRLLKVVDRMLPFLLNVRSNGRAWIDNGVRRSQVLAAHAFIEKDFPQVHSWIKEQVDHAVEQGWLQPA